MMKGMKNMTKTEFIARAKAALSYSTIYVKGGWGQPLTWGDTWENLQKQWSYNRIHSKAISAAIEASKAAGSTPYAFDCVCLVKGLLWGWKGDPDQYGGGAVYASNGIPDVTVDGFLTDCCTGVSDDFSDIEPGEYLYMNGHAGIYIGNGDVVECTPAWDGGVQLSKLGNLGFTGTRVRNWDYHGIIKTLVDDLPKANECVCPCCGARLTLTATKA